MATLQKLRSAGPLLVIFVGVALLAFVAGDALRIFQSPQGSQPVGSVNGEEISAADYQNMYEEYSNVVQLMRGGNTLSETEQNQIKDEVWGTYLSHKIIAAEAEKIGLTVTPAELKAIVAEGTHPLLLQSPFRNEQGKFDLDILNEFLASYDENDPAMAQQYKPIYEYWKFVEKTIMQNTLAEIEEDISYARQFYNDAVTIYNNKLMMFPSNVIANFYNFKEEKE